MHGMDAHRGDGSTKYASSDQLHAVNRHSRRDKKSRSGDWMIMFSSEYTFEILVQSLFDPSHGWCPASPGGGVRLAETELQWMSRRMENIEMRYNDITGVSESQSLRKADVHGSKYIFGEKDLMISYTEDLAKRIR